MLPDVVLPDSLAIVSLAAKAGTHASPNVSENVSNKASHLFLFLFVFMYLPSITTGAKQLSLILIRLLRG